MKVSRRSILKIAGGGVIMFTFFPKTVLASRGKLKSFRTGVHTGDKTRLVIETTTKPSFTVSYPDKKLVVSIANTATNTSVKPDLASGTLVKSLKQSQSGDRLLVTAELSESISKIPDSNILQLKPTGDHDYRLVFDFKAGANTAKAATTTKTEPAKKHTVVIDAGHGGKDPGCIGPKGTYEKTIVLSVAKKLKTKLEAAGFKAYLTRSSDKFLNLGTRASIAEKNNADLFLSLHANANPSRTMKGFSIYTLSQKASDEEARKLAEAENASDKIDVDGFEQYTSDIRNTLSSLQQQAVAEISTDYADECVGAFRKSSIKQQDGPKVRFAPFAVLRSTIPGALIELGHLSNSSEEALLRSSSYQEKLATAIANSVKNHDFSI